MRHAKSSWRDAETSDHERPLNGRGRRAAPIMGELLKRRALVPDLIVTSTALRALETAKAVTGACSYEGPMEITRRLYLAEPPAYYDALTEIPAGKERVLVIGHNPGISELVFELTGEEREMPTAAIAWIELPVLELSEVDRATRGRLVDFFRPPRDEKKR